ncbi:hypothetical protein GF325_06000 [Candidatus Bathyarchaeota archaeon]|nr:hypothetical protein [Candidatus Bathyarchaeota archaeon]
MALSKEEDFIIKILEEAGEMPFKELNEKCADQFEGCRIILKKMKEKGIVNFSGVLPGFTSTIKYIDPADREIVAKEMQGTSRDSGESNAPVQLGRPTDEQQFVLDMLEQNGGELGYKELNAAFSEKFEGLRLLLKKMKSLGIVDFDGMIPGFSATITLLLK